MHLTDLFQREVIHSSGGCESSKNKIKDMNINWWIRNIGPNYCISEFKCDLYSNRFTSKRCFVFRVIIILYTIDLYVVLIPQSESKWNKIVSIHTMSNLKILCLPPIANTLRDLDMRFTWVESTYLCLAFPWRCHYRERSRMWRRNKFTLTRFRGSSADAQILYKECLLLKFNLNRIWDWTSLRSSTWKVTQIVTVTDISKPNIDCSFYRLELKYSRYFIHLYIAQWISGRVLDSRPWRRGLEPHRRHCVVSLGKTLILA